MKKLKDKFNSFCKDKIPVLIEFPGGNMLGGLVYEVEGDVAMVGAPNDPKEKWICVNLSVVGMVAELKQTLFWAKMDQEVKKKFVVK